MICAICFGIHNYMLAVAMEKWRNSAIILCPEFIPFILIFAIYHSFFSKTSSVHSNLFYNNHGGFKFQTLIILLTRSMTAILLPVGVVLTTYYCKLIQISPAVIQSFSSMSSFTTAFLFFKLYGEKLNIQHKIGMALILSSVFIVGIFKSKQ